ncbi:MAG: PaaX family transcriptional regulator [Pseudonocardiaceae bacterium]|nr:PaaX family transcriptional regulator [Pseudonocardiaceae bacterium]
MTTERAAGAGRNGGPQPRQLIVTVYGLYAREDHGWLSVSSVVRLLADLGVDEPAVRSSISRLKRRDVLRSSSRDGVAGYALAPATVEILREGDIRIFDRRRAGSGEGWLLVVFSVPESERDKRHTLRTQLTRLGFGTAAPGVWIAPEHLYDETVEALGRLGLDRYADVFKAHHLAFGDLTSEVGRWWDLDGLQRRYAEFLACYRPVWRCWSRRRTTPPVAAFVDYVRVLTAWRRLPYLDPGLPLDLLPQGWNGVAAGELFAALHDRLRDPAHDRARTLINR